MPIPLKRTSFILCFVFCVGAAVNSFGQAADGGANVANGATDPAAKTAANAVPTTSGAAPVTAPDTAGTALDYLFNRKAKDGTTAATANSVGSRVGDKLTAVDALNGTGFSDPAMQSRFDAYLTLDAVHDEDIKKYEDTYNQIFDLIDNQKVFDAWKLLYPMADQRNLDAGLSRELGNRIEAIFNGDRKAQQIAKSNDKLRDTIDTASRTADMMAEEIDHDNSEKKQLGSGSGSSSGKKTGSGNDPTATGSTDSGSSGSSGGGQNMQLTNEYLKTLEARASIKLNEMKMDKISDQLEKDFASYIDTLFGSRRFYHVVLAADFYRSIFHEDEYPVAMANEVNASLQANKDIESYVQAFNNKMNKGEVAGATTVLQQAFMASEYHPDLLSIGLPMKDKVRDFSKQLATMQNLIEARDFGNLEKAIATIQKLAVDFDATKVTAMVNGVKLDSRLHLGKAKLAAQQGNQQQAMDEFQAAAQAWPGNPELNDAANTFFSKADTKNSYVTDFDRLYSGQDFRGIFDKQLMFAPAVAGDKDREKQLKDALLKVKDAEVASEKANLFMVNGDPYGAWEVIELATEAWPDDTKLNRLLGQLAVKSADFVRMLDQAKMARDRSDFGFSLTCYVNAQRMYPASQIANKAIEELSAQLLSSATKTAQN